MRRQGELLKRHGYKLYPLFFALFPLLSFFSANQSEIRSGNFNLAAFFIFNLIIAGALWLIAWITTRNAKKASILTVVMLAVFFTFGRAHDKLHNFVINTPVTPMGPTKILLLATALILILAWLGIRRLSSKNVDTANLVLSIVGLYLILSSLITIVLPYLSDSSGVVSDNNESQTASTLKKSTRAKPDIYYILLDGYGRQDILKDNFGYDNSDFINELKKRKFYVADKANSNYAHTHWSVPSTFNMGYLNYLSNQVGEKSNNREPLKKLTHYNEVTKIYKSIGYKYASIGSYWGWSESPASDINLIADNKTKSKILGIGLNEGTLVYLQTTALKPWVDTKLRGTLAARIIDAIEKTAKVPRVKEPTLSFTHLIIPHPPYLFDRNGAIKGLTQLELDNQGFSDRSEYIDQMIYTNKLTTELVDKIIKNSELPPIIIVAADHGPASTLSPSEFRQTDPNKMDVEGIKERMAILNAYYFPDNDYSKLYPGISPVNTFRLLLTQYFGQNFELLPDKSYLSDNKSNQYRLTEVTDLVKD
ncbi:MAG TPA: sulfatase-like hydrolase/transferase [Candidatus Saccharimonadales bacterium]|nr:sulfatase-like hydrolase/transferase [Candidatus Saccharimonadales bacterium]